MTTHIKSNQLPEVKIFGIGVTNTSISNILEYIEEKVKKRDKKVFITTPNPEILVYAHHHKDFQEVLNQAQVALPDGVGVVIAGMILGKGVINRVTGVDFMQEMCKHSVRNTDSVGFLGGRGNVAELTSQCLQKKYSGLTVGYTAEEWDEADFKKQLSKRGLKQLDYLFIAYGFPKQEMWIAENVNNLPITVAMGVGGAFDYLSGKVPRAPAWLRLMGFEWLFRLMKQSWRWKRQIALFEFMGLVIKEKLRNS